MLYCVADVVNCNLLSADKFLTAGRREKFDELESSAAVGINLGDVPQVERRLCPIRTRCYQANGCQRICESTQDRRRIHVETPGRIVSIAAEIRIVTQKSVLQACLPGISGPNARDLDNSHGQYMV